jgi:SAM-dependent methyltransferase
MDDSYASQYHVLQNHHWWFMARRSILKKALDQLPLPRKAHILEMGCGPGGNLQMLSQYGDVTACELDSILREHASKLGHANVVAGRLPDQIPLERAPYDLVVLFDVLEHIENDLEALCRLRDILKPSGKIVITVPAFMFLWSHHDVVNHHYRRYTMRGLKELFTRAGFDVEWATYFNFLLFPLALIEKISKRLFRCKSDNTMPIPPQWANCILRAVMAAEKHAFPALQFPFGSSLLFIASPDSGAQPHSS